jgi:hypothetical protein
LFWLLRRFPEEPIYSSGPGIYRPGPRIYSPGRIRESSDTEFGREHRSGGTVDRFLARIYRSATPRIHPKSDQSGKSSDRHHGHSRCLIRVPAARRAGPAKFVSRCIQKMGRGHARPSVNAIGGVSTLPKQSIVNRAVELIFPDWSLRRFPEEPIYSSGPGIYRPGPRICSPGRIRESSDTESGRENRSGGRVDRFLARIYRSATPVIHPKRPIRNAFDRHLGHSRYRKKVPAARRAGPAKCVSRCIQKMDRGHARPSAHAIGGVSTCPKQSIVIDRSSEVIGQLRSLHTRSQMMQQPFLKT